eukprot:gene5362-6506_t
MPLGSLAPAGWLLGQLLRQANSLSGALASSTFPGADTVNSSLWVGGDGHKDIGTTQWLPYWTNGNVPLVELLRAAGPSAVALLDPVLDLAGKVDGFMEYVLQHANKTNGWIGPYTNEPGDVNGHGLWDPLNMLRSLINYAQAHPEHERDIAGAVVAHLTQEAELVKTDPIIKWAQTRWPTFVELCQYAVDVIVPAHGTNPAVCPLGANRTQAMLLEAASIFQQKGMDWAGYYHRTGGVKFPTGPVLGWNTNDHGVNNAEGALRWPSVAYRMSGAAADAKEMDVVLGMLDKYQGQPNALFCADEVFCGRQPNRGTETCAVVEAIAALEFAFLTLGDVALLDRAERLAFNGLPAALTADMWTHVYVQQANSVFAGRSHPASGATTPAGPGESGSTSEPARWMGSRGLLARARHEAPDMELQSPTPPQGCATCRGRRSHGSARASFGSSPSGEDEDANFYGVSHFPCCITNFPQGWPKFAMHAYVLQHVGPTGLPSVVITSLVPANATLPAAFGGGRIATQSDYPFGDTAQIFVEGLSRPILLQIRIPGWATHATLNYQPALNGTLQRILCEPGKVTSTKVALHPTVRIEHGLGTLGTPFGSPVEYAGAGEPAAVPSADAASSLLLDGAASVIGSREAGKQDIRSGGPGDTASVLVTHPIYGQGHFLERVQMGFKYCAGYTPLPGQTKKGSVLSLHVVDAATQGGQWAALPHSALHERVLVLGLAALQGLDPGEKLFNTVYTSPPLDAYSFDNYKGYSPPQLIDVGNLHISNSEPLLLQVTFQNNERNLQVQLNPHTGLNLTVVWGADIGPDPPSPHLRWLVPPLNAVSVLRGPLLFALHPTEVKRVVKTYNDFPPTRPHAVDYEIGTNATWNYGLVLPTNQTAAGMIPRFDPKPSVGWTLDFPFDDSGEFPFSISLPARQMKTWGLWKGSMITDAPPSSPVRCNGSDECGSEETIHLVPFGCTNIRISVFPWTVEPNTSSW